jgi:hypothetical protein
MWRRFIPFFSIIALFSLVSCAAPLIPLAAGGAAGAGGYAWYKGELVKKFDRSLDSCYTATLNAVKGMGLSVHKKAKGPFEARIETTLASGKNVRIKIKKLSSKSSEIAIRVGALGSQEKSNHIMRQIEKRLFKKARKG